MENTFEEKFGANPLLALDELQQDLEKSDSPYIMLAPLMDSDLCMRIVGLLDQRLSNSEAASVLKFLGRVLLLIADRVPSLSAVTFSLGNAVLDYHEASLKSYLEAGNSEVVAATLFCLTGIVMSCKGALARILLSHLLASVDAGVAGECDNGGRCQESGDVRKQLVFLFLACVTVADGRDLEVFIRKTYLLPSILLGLVDDPPQHTARIIKILKEKVLLNFSVNLTLKKRLISKSLLCTMTQLFGIEEYYTGDTKLSRDAASVSHEIKDFLQHLCSDVCGFGVPSTGRYGISSDNAVTVLLKNLKSPWKYKEGVWFLLEVFKNGPLYVLKYLDSERKIIEGESEEDQIMYYNFLHILFTNSEFWKSAITSQENLACIRDKYLFLGLKGTVNSLRRSSSLSLCTLAIQCEARVLNKCSHFMCCSKANGKKCLSPEDVYLVLARVFPLGSILNLWSKHVVEFKGKTQSRNQVEDRVSGAQSDCVLQRYMLLSSLIDWLYEYVMAFGGLQKVHFNIDSVLSSLSQFSAESEQSITRYLSLCKSALNCLLLYENIDVDNQWGPQPLQLSVAIAFSADRAKVLLDMYMTCRHNVAQNSLLESWHEVMDSIHNMISCWLYFYLQRNGIICKEGETELWLKHLPHLEGKIKSFRHILEKVVSQHARYVTLVQAAKVDNVVSNSPSLKYKNVIDKDRLKDIEAFHQQNPFSLMVICALQCLQDAADGDTKCTNHLQDYVSAVLREYIHISNPEILSKFIIKHAASSKLNGLLLSYCRAWIGETCTVEPVTSPDLVRHLQAVFISKCVPSLADFKTSVHIPSGKSNLKDFGSFVSLVSLCNSDIASENIKNFIKEVYVYVLGEIDSCSHVYLAEWVLNLPTTYIQYKPFSCLKEGDVATLTLNNLKSSTSLPVVCLEYFRKLEDAFCYLLNNRELTMNVWPAFKPFLVLLFDASTAERLAQVCLSSASLGVTFKLLRKCLQVVSEKQQASTSLKLLLLNKLFLHWSKEDESVSTELMRKEASKVIRLLTSDEVGTLGKDVVKTLLSQPDDAYSILIVQHLLSVHAKFAKITALQMKKCGVNLPEQASLLLCMAKVTEASMEFADVLRVIKDEIIMKVSDKKNDELVYWDLFQILLEFRVLDEDTLVALLRKSRKALSSSKGVTLQYGIRMLASLRKILLEAEVKTILQRTIHEFTDLALKAMNTTLAGDEKLVQFVASLTPLVPLSNQDELSGLIEENSDCFKSAVNQVLKTFLEDPSVGHGYIEFIQRLLDTAHQSASIHAKEVMWMLMKQYVISTRKVLFSNPADNKLRDAVIGLMVAVVEADSSICKASHIPILVGAYGATRSRSDQMLYKLLNIYESQGKMKKHLPYLWGEMAIHYYRMNFTKVKMTDRSLPSLDFVIHHIDPSMLTNTCHHFDRLLPLEASVQKDYRNDVYDQRFLLSLYFYLCKHHCFNASTLVMGGALSLGITALSSKVPNVWAVGAAILHVLLQKTASSREHSDLLCYWLIRQVCSAIENKYDPLPFPFVVVFLAGVNVVLHPEEHMKDQLTSCLFLNSHFSLEQVIDLMSPVPYGNSACEKECLDVLRLLAKGMKFSEDIKLLLGLNITKKLLAILVSATADVQTKVMSLTLLELCCSSRDGVNELLLQQHLLAFLTTCLQQNSAMECIYLQGIVKVLRAVLKSLELKLSPCKAERTLCCKRPSDEDEEEPQKRIKIEVDEEEKVVPVLMMENGDGGHMMNCTDAVVSSAVEVNHSIIHTLLGCLQLLVSKMSTLGDHEMVREVRSLVEVLRSLVIAYSSSAEAVDVYKMSFEVSLVQIGNLLHFLADDRQCAVEHHGIQFSMS